MTYEIRGVDVEKYALLCQQTSPKRWFGNMKMTSICEVTNSAHQIQMTTIWPITKPPSWKFSAYATVNESLLFCLLFFPVHISCAQDPDCGLQSCRILGFFSDLDWISFSFQQETDPGDPNVTNCGHDAKNWCGIIVLWGKFQNFEITLLWTYVSNSSR